MPVDDAVRWEIIYAGKAHFFYFQQMVPHSPARIGAVYAADHRNFFHHRQYFKFPDFHGYGIRIAIGHQARRRTVPRHSEAAGIVNNDQVGTAFFDEFGADARSGTRSNDRFSLIDSLLQTVSYFLSCIGFPLPVHGLGIRFSLIDFK